MTADLFRVTAYSLSLMFLPAARNMPAAWAQSDSMATSPQLAQLNEVGPLYSPQQLDQLLAPIALYPDPLLAQILMASTYPLEVVEAAQWTRDRHNARLQQDQLDAALQPKGWDPSVKSLVPFPQVLQMMDTKLEWTQALGNAFLSQQGDVTNSIQRLRSEAQAARTLRSSPQETVSTQGQIILIEPATPEMIYVPYYDSRRVYGNWNYPENPPTYFPPPPNYGFVEGDGIFFGAGLVVVGALWGWDRWDWDRHDIHIDPDHYNRINDYRISHNQHPRSTETTWRHDPSHRRGVPYGDAGVRQRFQPGAAGSPENRRDYRGYEKRSGAAMPLNETAVPVLRSPPVVEEHKPAQPAAPAAAPAPKDVRQHDRPQPAVPAAPSRQPSAHATAPAFSSFGRGAEVRSESQRGQSSRQSSPAIMQEHRANTPPAQHRSAPPAQQRNSSPTQSSPAEAPHQKKP